jgi:peptide/nickel transport system substrate-binding protein
VTSTGYWRHGLALAITAAMAFAACAPGPSGGGSPSPVAKRGAGGTLKILYWQAPTILNIHQATGTKDYDAARLIIEPMGAWDPEGKPQPTLVKEVPTLENKGISSDFKTTTWNLKTGVKWSDGTDFTADDVVFTWKYMSDPKTAATTTDYVENIAKVEAKDKSTVVVTWKTPQANHYQFGIGGTTAIIQQKQFEPCIGDKAAQCPANNAPIGTGPFKLKEFKSGDVITYEMNTNYRDPNQPNFTDVTLKGGGDAESAARAVLQTGDYDLAWNLQILPAVLKPMIDQSTKGTVYGQKAGDVERLMFNFSDPTKEVNGQRSEKSTKHPFFADKNVRIAFAKASNRASVANELYIPKVQGEPTCNIVEAIPGKSTNTAGLDVCKFDLQAAAKMLDDAGWVKGSDGIRAKGGVRMEVLYNTSTIAVRQRTQDIIKRDWESIGIKVTLKSAPSATFFSNASPDSANYMYADLNMFTSSTDPDPQNFLSSNWTCRNIAQKENNWQGNNYQRYCSTEYDKIIADLSAELDPAKRTALAVKANDWLVSEAVVVPLVWRVLASAKAKNLNTPLVEDSFDSPHWNIAAWTRSQ